MNSGPATAVNDPPRTKGVGRAIGDALARQGARVALLDGRPGDGVIACDVADERAVDAAFAAVERMLGRVTLLVCNAGILRARPIEEVSLDEWPLTFDVNVTGAFVRAKRALPGMREEGYGRVVCIGSSAGKAGGYKHLATYAASKAALMSLARSIATEYAGHGITSNAIAPAAIETDMIAGLTGFQTRSPSVASRKAEDVAAAAVFLCSSLTGYVTAEVMDVNGGYLVD